MYTLKIFELKVWNYHSSYYYYYYLFFLFFVIANFANSTDAEILINSVQILLYYWIQIKEIKRNERNPLHGTRVLQTCRSQLFLKVINVRKSEQYTLWMALYSLVCTYLWIGEFVVEYGKSEFTDLNTWKVIIFTEFFIVYRFSTITLGKLRLDSSTQNWRTWNSVYRYFFK